VELSFTFEVEMGNVCGKVYQPARSSETKDKKEKFTLVRQTTPYAQPCPRPLRPGLRLKPDSVGHNTFSSRVASGLRLQPLCSTLYHRELHATPTLTTACALCHWTTKDTEFGSSRTAIN